MPIELHPSEPFFVTLCLAILGNTTVRVNLYLIGGLAFSLLGAYLQDYRVVDLLR